MNATPSELVMLGILFVILAVLIIRPWLGTFQRKLDRQNRIIRRASARIRIIKVKMEYRSTLKRTIADNKKDARDSR